jgi:hypothetical protein
MNGCAIALSTMFDRMPLIAITQSLDVEPGAGRPR